MKDLSNKKYTIIAILFFATVLFGGVRLALADGSTPCYTDNGLSAVSSLFPAQYCSVTGTIPTIINILLSFLGIVAVFFIIIGGYKMVVSSGNEEAFTSGRQTVLYAIIGLLVAIFAYAIVTIVGNSISNTSSGSSSSTGSSNASSSNSSTGGSTGNNNNSSNSTSGSGGGNGSSASSANGCTVAAIDYIAVNITSPAPIPVDDTDGSGDVSYTITPGNPAPAGCNMPFETYVLDGSQAAPESTDSPVDSGTGFGENTLRIPESLSQDGSVNIYVVYTDSTGAKMSDSADVSITQTSQDDNSDNNND